MILAEIFPWEGMTRLLEYGAVGILAFAFVFTLWLLWKKIQQTDDIIMLLKDEQETTTDALEQIREDDSRVDKIIDVIQQNTEAMTSVRMTVEQNTEVMSRLDIDFSAKLDKIESALQDRDRRST